MNSPITGKPMKLIHKVTTLEFQAKGYEVMYYSFLCEDSGEEFTTDELDEIHLKQVHLQAKYNF